MPLTFRIKLIGYQKHERSEQVRVLSSYICDYMESVENGLPSKEERSNKS